MKLSGFMCDRCGKHFDRCTVKNDKGHTLVSAGLIDVKGLVQRYELCTDCMLDVRKYLTDPRAHVGVYDEGLDEDYDLLEQKVKEASEA